MHTENKYSVMTARGNLPIMLYLTPNLSFDDFFLQVQHIQDIYPIRKNKGSVSKFKLISDEGCAW